MNHLTINNGKIRDYKYGNGQVVVHHNGDFRMHYSTQFGRFNLLSNEEKYSCHVAIYEGTKKIMSCNINVDYDAEGGNVDDAIYLIQEDIKSHWIDTARDKKEQVIRFMIKYADQIDNGNGKHRLEQIDKQMAQLTIEAERLRRWVK